MKTRDSGMPEHDQWKTFFAPETILRALGLDRARGPVVDVGCGYGTFTLPAARLTGQPVVGIDIEPALVTLLAEQARNLGLTGVSALQRDVVHAGLGLPSRTADVVLLFNLLHCEDPAALLVRARRVLIPGGRVGVIHWRSDIPTPRGPDRLIRPTPAACRQWMVAAGLAVVVEPTLLEPYHFGLVGAVTAAV